MLVAKGFETTTDRNPKLWHFDGKSAEKSLFFVHIFDIFHLFSLILSQF